MLGPEHPSDTPGALFPEVTQLNFITVLSSSEKHHYFTALGCLVPSCFVMLVDVGVNVTCHMCHSSSPAPQPCGCGHLWLFKGRVLVLLWFVWKHDTIYEANIQDEMAEKLGYLPF